MKLSSVLWGMVFICVGIILGLNAFEITNIDIFFDGWWTLFIIVPSFIGLFKKEDITGSLIFLLVGIVLLLGANDLVDFDILSRLFLPILLVVIGLAIVFKNDNKASKSVKKAKKDGLNTICTTFKEEIIEADEIDGVNLETVFGSTKYDASKVKLTADAYLKISTVFGSTRVIVPKSASVVMKKDGVFGENINKTSKGTGKYTIYIESSCVFGSVIVDDK